MTRIRASRRFLSVFTTGLVFASGCVGRPDAEVGVFEQPQEGPPTGVNFDWPEASTGECLPGLYSGEFNCVFESEGTFPIGPLSGPITLELRETLNGEFLEIASGTLAGNVGFFVFTTELTGNLSCATDELDVESLGGTFPGGTFSGTLDGRLDRATQTLTGTWAMAPTGGAPCVGTWSAVRAP